MGSLGALVKAWRLASKLSRAEFARRIGGTVKRQNIEQLENGDAHQPRYLPQLAKAMGTTVDDLLALRMPAPREPGKYAQGPRAGASDLVLTDSNRGVTVIEAKTLVSMSDAIHAFARHLQHADPVTRDAIGPMVLRVLQQPAEAAQVAAVVEALLASADRVRRASGAPSEGATWDAIAPKTSPPPAPSPQRARLIDDQTMSARPPPPPRKVRR